MTEVCTNDDLLAALRAHEQSIGQIVLTARPKIQQLKTMAADMDANSLVPIQNTLDSILSSANLKTTDIVDMAGFQKGATREEIEKSLASTFGLNIVNGRVLVTDPNAVDLTALQDLRRLLGGLNAIKLLLPEFATCPDQDDMLAGAQFKSRFIIVTTITKIILIPGKGCKADSQIMEEITLGVDVPLQKVLYDHPELTRADLNVYIFWFGKPQSRPDLRQKALSFGLDENEYFDAVLRRSSETFKVKVIDNPTVQICKFSNTFGDDADTILSRDFGNNKPTINLSPTPQDVMDQVTKSGVLTVQPGRVNKYGLQDYGSPACQFLSVVNFEKSFGSQNNGTSPCLDASPDLSPVFDALFGALNTVTKALNSLINEVVSSFMWVVNKITALISTLDAFLQKLITCIFPPGFLTIKADPLAKLAQLLQDGLNIFQGFFTALGDLLNILAPLACIKASMADLMSKAEKEAFPGLACILSLFSFDVCMSISVNIGQMEGSLAFQAISSALNNLMMLAITLSSVLGNLPGRWNYNNCLPVTSAILLVKLGLRAAEASAGIPL